MSVIGHNALVGAAGNQGGYQISRSLRFRNSATAYLSRSPASAGNQQKMTFSFWVKRGQLTTRGIYCSGASGSGATQGGAFIQFAGDNFTVNQQTNNAYDWILTTTQVFRDPSAWYHIVVVIDTTQATASNRVLLYVNGVQVTAFSASTYPTLNLSTKFNASGATNLGATIDAGAVYFPFDGYLADVYFIDGQALTPSSFGEANAVTGVWDPKRYSGTYGTNGFYLNFSDNSAATAAAIGKDYSGNGNNWTPNNISVTAGTTYDSMIDSPTNYVDGGNGRGNYAVMNPLVATASTMSNANLTVTGQGAAAYFSSSTFPFGPTGKWYCEVTCGSVGGAYTPHQFGLGPNTRNTSTSLNIYLNNYGQVGNQNTIALPSGSYVDIQTSGLNYTQANGDIIQFAYDADTGKSWIGINNSWVGTSLTAYNGAPSTGTNPTNTFTANTLLWLFTAPFGSGTAASFNFGQRPFTYTPPSGYKALNTYNLPAPSIANGANHFAATTYTGTGATQNVSNAVNGVSFQPDFAWIKVRSTAAYHALVDSLRVGTGGLSILSSNATDAEWTSNLSSYVTGFNSNGIALGNQASTAYYVNRSGDTYVGWQWKGGGTAVTNNSGTITSQVSANTSAGISIITYTGTGANATVGHGLGVAPSMVIVKARNLPNSIARPWAVWHTALSATEVIFLNDTAAKSTGATTYWNSTLPTSSVFSVGTEPVVNGATGTVGQYVAYCFSAVRGFSAFGSYTGNGSADGPFVFTNMRPRWLLVKRTDAVGSWGVIDTSRDTYNVTTKLLFPNASDAENTSYTPQDILSNGFKLRDTTYNVNGGTYIYAAFAENPFSIARAR